MVEQQALSAAFVEVGRGFFEQRVNSAFKLELLELERRKRRR
jgi:hypothetical protein